MAKRTVLEPLRRHVERHLRTLPDGSKVLVACSGGADSLALAIASRNAGDHLKYQVAALVVDHGMQTGSDRIAQQAAAHCRDIGIEDVAIERARIDESDPGGPEARARHVRYAILRRHAHRIGATAVLLGHTRDDQAETVLLGLTRGSGIRSLAGMRPIDGLWHRPLLEVTRAQTEAVCEFYGIDFWIDPTNLGRPDDPLRSRLRHTVMPVLYDVLGDGVATGLTRTAHLVQRDLDFLDECSQTLFDQVLVASSDQTENSNDLGAIRLHIKPLAATHEAIRTRVIHRAMIAAGSPPGSVTSTHVARVDELLTHWHGQGPIHVPGSIRVWREHGMLEFQCG